MAVPDQENPPPLFGPGVRALVVDDEPALRRVLQFRLEWMGIEVEVAASGQEAKDMIESRPQFDVLLSDIMMPGDMNGYDLARYVHEAKPELPVVFCTGYANELTKPHAMELAVHLLRKPFTASELTTALHRALDVRIP